MKALAAVALREKLFKTPPPARRQAYTTVRPVYSRKMRRRVYAFGDSRFALWLELEFDPAVASFNLEPPLFPLVDGAGEDDPVSIPMAAVSLDKANHLTLHFEESDLGSKGRPAIAERISRSQDWRALGASIAFWKDLADLGRLDRANKHALLRYLCAPQVVVNAEIERLILRELGTVRKLCICDILQKLDAFDAEYVKTALAHLISNKKVFLDMARRFGVLSEISRQDIFHA
jgi:hypothetical protein